jgi:hypothetical protein
MGDRLLANRILELQMNLGRIASLVIVTVAIVGVFVEIPIVSDYAFWVLVAAYVVWLGVHPPAKKFRPGDIGSLVLVLVAIVGLLVEILIVSNYAFWVVAAAYLVIVGYTKP